MLPATLPADVPIDNDDGFSMQRELGKELGRFEAYLDVWPFEAEPLCVSLRRANLLPALTLLEDDGAVYSVYENGGWVWFRIEGRA